LPTLLAGFSIDLPALLLVVGLIVALLRFPQINSTFFAVGALNGLLLQSIFEPRHRTDTIQPSTIR
jgi:hypothetical protein